MLKKFSGLLFFVLALAFVSYYRFDIATYIIDNIIFQKEAIEILLESNVFALTFDVGHNYGIGGTDEEFIMKHKDRLSHIHLHDAQGGKNHLALGTGEIDIGKYINLAKEQNCRIVLETKTIDGLKQSVEWLKGV